MIYLDHAATTPLDGGALKAMLPYMTEHYGNAASQHSAGRIAANAVIASRDDIAGVMGVSPEKLYFTSGGTEAGNTALKGVCSHRRGAGRHIVLSAIEHPALLESAKDLKRFGYETTLVMPDERGVVTADAVDAAIRSDTVFCAVMAANNETGVIQPVKNIYEVCKSRGVFYYCDCVQTAGVLPFAGFPADGVGFSAHKFYGPKGFGGLYMGGNCFDRLISGGGQERGLRGGTTFVAGAVGCAYALKKAAAESGENNRKVRALKTAFTDRVLNEIDGAHLNGSADDTLPAHANISFDGCDGVQVVLALDLKGIAVSAGSACAAGATAPSYVVAASWGEERAKSAVRFSFGKNNTAEEVEKTVAALKDIVKKIRGGRG